MFYKKEIDDYVMIQFIILYTLDTVNKAIPYDILINLVLENCNISYTDFQIALSNLVETEHVRTFQGESKPMYEIEPNGSRASKAFSKKVPIYIKEPIKNSIKPMLREEMIKNRVRGTITPIRHDEFSAECGLYDDDGTPLLELSFYAGRREEAAKIAEFFRNNPDKVYEGILKLIVHDEN